MRSARYLLCLRSYETIDSFSRDALHNKRLFVFYLRQIRWCFIITYVIHKILLNFMKLWMEARKFDFKQNPPDSGNLFFREISGESIPWKEKDIISHFLPTNNNLKARTIKLCPHWTTWSGLTTPIEVTCSGRGSFWNRKSKEEHVTLATFSFRRISRMLLVSGEFHFPLCSPRNRIVQVFKHW